MVWFNQTLTSGQWALEVQSQKLKESIINLFVYYFAVFFLLYSCSMIKYSICYVCRIVKKQVSPPRNKSRRRRRQITFIISHLTGVDIPRELVPVLGLSGRSKTVPTLPRSLFLLRFSFFSFSIQSGAKRIILSPGRDPRK